jgi:hypothetical protein
VQIVVGDDGSTALGDPALDELQHLGGRDRVHLAAEQGDATRLRRRDAGGLTVHGPSLPQTR